MFPLNQGWGIQTNIFETNVLNLAKNFQLFFDQFFGSPFFSSAGQNKWLVVPWIA